MFERFTQEAREAVITAQKEARALRHGRVGTEDVLLGVLAAGGQPARREASNLGAHVLGDLGITRDGVREVVARMVRRDAPAEPDPEALAAIGIDLDAVRRRVEGSFGRGALDGPRGRSGHIPFSPRAKKVLELSLREALALRDHHIGTEHILLGILREGQGMAAVILTQAGLDLAAIRAAVITARTRSG